jgi:hypothetical protein
MEIGLFVAGVLVGWFINHFYYRKQIAQARTDREESRRVNEGLARFLEALSQSLGGGRTVAFGRDEKGNLRYEVLNHTITVGTGALLWEGYAPTVTVGPPSERPPAPSS